jgi:GntR family transcriptional repressor for pyruvate dehydrogenase complex
VPSSPVQYEPVSRRPVPDVIAERLTMLIAAGSLQPGDRLPAEPELARQFGVGRSSLREAVRKLHTLGVVDVVNGRGTFIREPPEDDPTLRFLRWSARDGFAAAEVLETRIGLEVTAAGLACLRASDNELATLLHLSAGHEADHTSAGVVQLVETDQRFHAALIAASHNEVLRQLYEPLVARLAEFRRHTLSLAGAPERSAHDHASIATALQTRDAAAARRAVVRHLGTLYGEVLTASPGGAVDHADPVPVLEAMC